MKHATIPLQTIQGTQKPFQDESESAVCIALKYSSDTGFCRLILPAVVINMQSQAAADSDYLVSGQDLLDWENQYGQIPAESLVSTERV